eukprot:TRINITY_DN667_c0_g1_i8.p1 TRINITY_DN667_c0_g1~~TRINITY_DN667_c0_g1_i8.p1  ORF type:complete len:332 (+),score=45.66 TRINITY_DN667_c0_g1_i8:350-1345(+)
MGRVKVNTQERIPLDGPRLVAFSKRRAGLFKKASELSVLCDTQIAVVVFSEKGHAYTFAHPDLETVVSNYRNPNPTETLLPSSELRVRDGDRHFQSRLPEYERAVHILKTDRRRNQELKEIKKLVSDDAIWRQDVHTLTYEQTLEACQQLQRLLTSYEEYQGRQQQPGGGECQGRQQQPGGGEYQWRQQPACDVSPATGLSTPAQSTIHLDLGCSPDPQPSQDVDKWMATLPQPSQDVDEWITSQDVEEWIAAIPHQSPDLDQWIAAIPQQSQDVDQWIATLPQPSQDVDQWIAPIPQQSQDVDQWIATLPQPSPDADELIGTLLSQDYFS